MKIVKDNLSRYLTYVLLSEVDPSCSSKRTVIVTEIHNPPLAREHEGRGRQGKYVTPLRPLLLGIPSFEGKCSFEGKYTTLANRIGLFSRFFQDEMSRNPELAKKLKHQRDEMDHNLWKQSESMKPGEREYNRLISGKIREVLKSSLQSLEKEGIVQLETHYRIVPDTDATMEDGTTRPRSTVEEVEGWNKYREAIGQEAARPNSLLDAETVECLIFGYDNKESLIWQESPNESIKCSPRQKAAIENYELYVRQCSVMKYYGLDELPDREKKTIISNSGLFFQNHRLVKMYNQIDDELRGHLFGDIKFWQEIRYEVIDRKKAERYLSDKAFDSGQAATHVSQEVLKYMDGQMEKHIVEARPDDWKDIPGAFGKVPDSPLGHYRSAARLHNKLKGLYDTVDKGIERQVQ